MSIGFYFDDTEEEGCSNPQEIYELYEKIRQLEKQLEDLRTKHKRLLETADILDTALREYQKKYGELDE